MAVLFRCSGCKQKLKVADRKIGLAIKCPACGSKVLVPTPPQSKPSVESEQKKTLEKKAALKEQAAREKAIAEKKLAAQKKLAEEQAALEKQAELERLAELEKEAALEKKALEEKAAAPPIVEPEYEEEELEFDEELEFEEETPASLDDASDFLEEEAFPEEEPFSEESKEEELFGQEGSPLESDSPDWFGKDAEESLEEEVEQPAPAAEQTPIAPAVAANMWNHIEDDEDEGGGEDEGFTVSRRGGDDEEMDLTPMVDVTFLLLIFFMITASFNIQKTIQTPPPEKDNKGATQSVQDPQDIMDASIKVEISDDNTIYVEDEPLSNPEELEGRIREVMRGAGGDDGKNELVLSASDKSFHEMTIKVIDAANSAHVQKIRMVTYKGGGD